MIFTPDPSKNFPKVSPEEDLNEYEDFEVN
jgi:hypothetical protein